MSRRSYFQRRARWAQGSRPADDLATHSFEQDIRVDLHQAYSRKRR